MRALITLVISALVVGTPAAGWAQAVGGAQITGFVRDSSGATLPGVDVTVTQTDTGIARTTVTGADGAFAFPNLPVGPYQLKANLQGFSAFVQDGIVLQVNSNPQVNITMQIGALSEQLTVTANASMVETRSTGIGQVIDNQRVVELPLNGRQATELIFLSGLATSAPAADLNTNKNYPTVTISVAGGQANGMTYIMDGGTHNDPFNNLNLPTPFPDALQEFKVETSALPARYGHHASSAVNLVTKSGTNNYRGTLFGFVRNYRFNARNALATTNDSLKRNQFGGAIGGPLLRNKAFFFGAYQGRIEKQTPPTAIRWVPTPAMLAGDFTALTSPACNGGRQVELRAPFVGNRVAPSQLNPVALAYSRYLPTATDPCGRVQFGIPNDSTEHQALGRIDYTLNQQHTFFTRYLFARYENPATYDGQNVLTLSRTGQENIANSVVTGHKWLPTSSLVNSFNVTFNKTLNDRPLPEFFTATELGSRISSPYPGYFGVSVTGNGFTVGAGGTNPGYFNSTAFQLVDDVDLVRGSHQISAGVNWIHTEIETSNNRPTNGQFTFNGQTTGLSMADFMVGSVSGGFLQGNPVFDYQDHDYIGVYLQDDWRVRPNFTVNVGMRWEPFIPLRNTYSWVSHFDKTRFDQNLRSTVYPQAPAGLIFPGDAGYPGRGASRKKMANFAPRIGAIWTPSGDDSLSVRGSWGIFYDTPHLFFNTRFTNNPPWGAQLTIANPAGGFTDPYLGYPGGNPFPALNDNWATAAFPAFGVYVNAPLDMEPTAAAAVEPERAERFWRLAGLGQLPRQPHRQSVAGDRTESGGADCRRHHRQHQPAPRAVPAGSGEGPSLRHHRPRRRHRPRQLPRHAAVGAAPPGEQLQHPVELDGLQVHVRSGDQRDHRADRRRPQQPRSRLRLLLVGPPPRRELLGGRADAGVLEQRRAGRLQRLADLADRPLAERQPLLRDHRRGQRADRHGRPAGGADPRRPVRRRHRRQLPEPRRLHQPGQRHLQRPQAVHHPEPVDLPERHRHHPLVPDGHAHAAVPLGDLQRGELRQPAGRRSPR